MQTEWLCELCGVRIYQIPHGCDLVRFDVLGYESRVLGTIYINTIEQAHQANRELSCGGCPICDGWEDGYGNKCTQNGW